MKKWIDIVLAAIIATSLVTIFAVVLSAVLTLGERMTKLEESQEHYALGTVPLAVVAQAKGRDGKWETLTVQPIPDSGMLATATTRP